MNSAWRTAQGNIYRFVFLLPRQRCGAAGSGLDTTIN
jgi:hypothetical protein